MVFIVHWENRGRAARHFADGNVEHENRHLEDVQTNDLLHEVGFINNDKQARHHQNDEQQVMRVAGQELQVE